VFKKLGKDLTKMIPKYKAKEEKELTDQNVGEEVLEKDEKKVESKQSKAMKSLGGFGRKLRRKTNQVLGKLRLTSIKLHIENSAITTLRGYWSLELKLIHKIGNTSLKGY
jgi:hypothetical protein